MTGDQCKSILSACNWRDRWFSLEVCGDIVSRTLRCIIATCGVFHSFVVSFAQWHLCYRCIWLNEGGFKLRGGGLRRWPWNELISRQSNSIPARIKSAAVKNLYVRHRIGAKTHESVSHWGITRECLAVLSRCIEPIHNDQMNTWELSRGVNTHVAAEMQLLPDVIFSQRCLSGSSKHLISLTLLMLCKALRLPYAGYYYVLLLTLVGYICLISEAVSKQVTN